MNIIAHTSILVAVQTPAARAPQDHFRPRYQVPLEVGERLRRIERLDQDLGVLEGSVADRALLRDALSYNAYGTASIEGNPLSLDQVQSVLARGPTPDAMRTPDEREILNWATFMEALDEHPIPRRVTDVEAMHAQLFAGVMSKDRGLGRIKDRPN